MERERMETLLGTARAFMESRVMLTGAELDLYTLLAGEPMTASQVAERLGADLRALTIVMDALAAMDLLVKRDGRYQTAPGVDALLSETSPKSILPMVLHSANLWQRWSQLTAIVAPHRAPDHSWDLNSFIGAMHAIGSPLAPQIVEAVQPGDARRLIDIGGASGTYTIAFLRACPSLRATLFDRPPVVEMARERLTAAGVLDRIDLVPGDFYTDPLPGGHDLAFLSAIIHQNSPEQNVDLYRKVLDALEPGGRIVIRDHVLSPYRTHPRSGAMFAVNMLTGTGGGNSYTFAEIQGGLEAAGFERVRLMRDDERMDGLVDAFRPGS